MDYLVRAGAPFAVRVCSAGLFDNCCANVHMEVVNMSVPCLTLSHTMYWLYRSELLWHSIRGLA